MKPLSPPYLQAILDLLTLLPLCIYAKTFSPFCLAVVGTWIGIRRSCHHCGWTWGMAFMSLITENLIMPEHPKPIMAAVYICTQVQRVLVFPPWMTCRTFFASLWTIVTPSLSLLTMFFAFPVFLGPFFGFFLGSAALPASLALICGIQSSYGYAFKPGEVMVLAMGLALAIERVPILSVGIVAAGILIAGFRGKLYTPSVILAAIWSWWFGHIQIGEEPVTWLLGEILSHPGTCIYWLLLMFTAPLPFLMPTTSIDVRRKYFHLLIVLIVLPVYHHSFAFLKTSLAIAFCLLVTSEALRTESRSDLANALIKRVVRNGRGDVFRMDGIWLLFGCALPIWLEEQPVVEGLGGIFLIGFGDAVASLVGQSLPRSLAVRSPFTKKSVLGSLAFWLSTTGVIWMHSGTERSFAYETFIMAIVEAYCSITDNAVLGIGWWMLLKARYLER